MGDWYNAFWERVAQLWVILNCLPNNCNLETMSFQDYLALLNKYSRVQILLCVHMTTFAYMQNLHIRKMRFALGLRQVQIFQLLHTCKFAYVSKCVHMERFAYVCKFCIYAKFAHVCKSLHVYRPLDTYKIKIERCLCILPFSQSSKRKAMTRNQYNEKQRPALETTMGNIRITCPCNEQPLTPHFYIEKVGFTRVYMFFLFCSKK